MHIRGPLPIALGLLGALIVGPALPGVSQEEASGDPAQEEDAATPPPQALDDFATCDLDRGGWISFREARACLEYGKEKFRLVDTDSDGRINLEEFSTHVRETIDRAGAFKPPSRSPGVDLSLMQSNRELVEAFDIDRSGGLAPGEVEQLAEEGGWRSEMDGLLVGLDKNGNRELEFEEMAPLAQFLTRTRISAEGLSGGTDRTVEDLINELVSENVAPADPSEELDPGAPGAPPRMPGPVPPFRRLDVDGNRFIERIDLHALVGSARLSVRPERVLDALDLDGDGRLSEHEFLESIRSPNDP